MMNSASERRLAENEVIFRQLNEKIEKGFEEIKRMADEDGQHFRAEHRDLPLQFYCECSDETCRKRIKITPEQYSKIHKRRDRFIIICGHEDSRVEHTITKTDNFCIIEKFNKPPESASKLHKTDVSNN